MSRKFTVVQGGKSSSTSAIRKLKDEFLWEITFVTERNIKSIALFADLIDELKLNKTETQDYTTLEKIARVTSSGAWYVRLMKIAWTERVVIRSATDRVKKEIYSLKPPNPDKMTREAKKLREKKQKEERRKNNLSVLRPYRLKPNK